MESTGNAPATAQVTVERWPTELPLLGLVVGAAIVVWVLAALTIVGLAYALLIGAFLFFGHVAFVAHVRGSAVCVGPDQFPELHARVQELARRAGLRTAPETYVMEASGTLNALATKFLGANLLVLFSDLLDACGDDADARDMIIGHELGHVRSGHLRFTWLLVPGLVLPFLGSAYSRAREYTCDRWGAGLTGTRAGALRGLAILAAGGQHGPKVDLAAFARQRTRLDTGWMTLGTWVASHPPLCARIAAIEPALAPVRSPVRGPVRAIAILGLGMAAPAVLGTVLLVGAFTKIAELAEAAEREAPAAEAAATRSDDGEGMATATARAREDLQALAGTLERYRERAGRYPADVHELYAAWTAERSGGPQPLDPFEAASTATPWTERATCCGAPVPMARATPGTTSICGPGAWLPSARDATCRS